ncbi:MAG: 2-oxoglutarate and iron-dependent oxygenase domain-containing protein, partial [Rhodospirillaceae bacterium]
MEQFRARQVSETALPVIDISGLRSADTADRLAVGAEIGAACRGLGFMYIAGHGVPADLRAAVFEEAARFFAQPEDRKLAVHMNNSPCNRGYEPMRHQTLEAGTPPDLKEGFYIAEDMDEDHPRVRAGHFNFGANQWPEGMPGFRTTMSRYHGEMLTLGSLLMRGIALSLDLEEDFFADYCSDPLSRLRLLHYPPQPADPHPGEKGCGAHTDFGGITILMQDDNGGLQVMGSDGDWIHAPPLPDTYLVNMGDLI